MGGLNRVGRGRVEVGALLSHDVSTSLNNKMIGGKRGKNMEKVLRAFTWGAGGRPHC